MITFPSIQTTSAFTTRKTFRAPNAVSSAPFARLLAARGRTQSTHLSPPIRRPSKSLKPDCLSMKLSVMSWAESTTSRSFSAPSVISLCAPIASAFVQSSPAGIVCALSAILGAFGSRVSTTMRGIGNCQYNVKPLLSIEVILTPNCIRSEKFKREMELSGGSFN